MQRRILRLCDTRPKRYVRAMFYCRGGTKRCLEEVQIAPRCNHLRVKKIALRHGVMLSGHSTSTISRPHPALKQYEERVHTMNELIVSFQRWAGSADDDINLFLVGDKNAGSYMRVTMGDLLVWALKLDPSLHQDTIGKLSSSRAFDWCNKNVAVSV